MRIIVPLLICITLIHSPAQVPQRPAYPNIVLIVADDFGYGDLGCYGAEKTATPHVNQLASNGIRFTDAFVASSLCSPSRYSMLTGRYSWRTSLKKGVLTPFAPPLIEEGRTTLASLLKRKGYFTACVGKWHLGFNWALKEDAPADATESIFDSWGLQHQQYIDFSKPVKGGPLAKGFDYFFGIAGSNNMIPFVFIENEKVLAPPSVPTDFGPKTLRAPDWDLRSLDQKLLAKAVHVIDEHLQKTPPDPFFFYFPTSAIHLPCLPTITKGKSSAGLRGDMVVEFDIMVGEIVKALDRNGVLNNTLIIVTSDNGPQPGDPYAQVEKFRSSDFGAGYNLYQAYFANYQPRYEGIGGQPKGWLTYDHDPTAGFLGFKSDAWDGGLRVPLIVHWPEKIKSGSVSAVPVCLTDLLATLADVTGERLNEGEGEDSYSFFNNLTRRQAVAVRESMTLVAGRSGAMVVRKDNWKYIEATGTPDRSSPDAYPPPPNEYPGAARVDETQLYNLGKDLYEKKNLAGDMPGKVEELKSIIKKVKTTVKSEHK